MNRLQAIIFDVDGTLAETERDAHLPAFNRAFADFGLPWCWDAALYRRLLAVAGGRERIAAYAAACDPLRAGNAGFAELSARLYRAKTAYSRRQLASGRVALRPGVASLIAEAGRRGIRLAIATTTAAENVDALLAGTLGAEARARFAVIGSGDTVRAKKPAPDIYRWVLARLALPATACIAIEDSANGLRAATAAGLKTVLTVSAFAADDGSPSISPPAADGGNFSGACAVVPDLGNTTLTQLAKYLNQS